jgi:protein TonB
MEAVNLKIPLALSLMVHFLALLSFSARPFSPQSRMDITPMEILSLAEEEPKPAIQEPKAKVERIMKPTSPPKTEKVVKLDEILPPQPQPLAESLPVSKAEPPMTPEEVNLPQAKSTEGASSAAASDDGNFYQHSMAPVRGDAGESPRLGSDSPVGDSKSPMSVRDAVRNLRIAIRSKVSPGYPEAARRSGVQGTSVIKVRVLPSGQIGEALVEESAGATARHAALDQAALDAARRWTFNLPKDNGATGTLWVLIPFEFKLQ